MAALDGDHAQLPAGLATEVGERRQFLLDDGTRLQLNTASAVDVQFTAQRRLIVLRRGEIFIDTGKDAASVIGDGQRTRHGADLIAAGNGLDLDIVFDDVYLGNL